MPPAAARAVSKFASARSNCSTTVSPTMAPEASSAVWPARTQAGRRSRSPRARSRTAPPAKADSLARCSSDHPSRNSPYCYAPHPVSPGPTPHHGWSAGGAIGPPRCHPFKIISVRWRDGGSPAAWRAQRAGGLARRRVSGALAGTEGCGLAGWRDGGHGGLAGCCSPLRAPAGVLRAGDAGPDQLQSRPRAIGAAGLRRPAPGLPLARPACPGPGVALVGCGVQRPVRVVQMRPADGAQVRASGQDQRVDVVVGGDARRRRWWRCRPGS